MLCTSGAVMVIAVRWQAGELATLKHRELQDTYNSAKRGHAQLRYLSLVSVAASLQGGTMFVAFRLLLSLHPHRPLMGLLASQTTHHS